MPHSKTDIECIGMAMTESGLLSSSRYVKAAFLNPNPSSPPISNIDLKIFYVEFEDAQEEHVSDTSKTSR